MATHLKYLSSVAGPSVGLGALLAATSWIVACQQQPPPKPDPAAPPSWSAPSTVNGSGIIREPDESFTLGSRPSIDATSDMPSPPAQLTPWPKTPVASTTDMSLRPLPVVPVPSSSPPS